MNEREPFKKRFSTNGSARFSAIIFARPNDPDEKRQFVKYTFVSAENNFRKFIRGQKGFPEAVYYHLYERKSGNYLHSYNLKTNSIFDAKQPSIHSS